MNSKKLSEAISGVNDKYYEEAANYQPKQKKRPWVKWGAIAACLCLVIVGSFLVPHILEDDNNNPNVNPAAYPYVMVNNIIYLIDSEGYVASELPSGYVEIGKIEGNASADKAQNWYSQGCKVGESIYQSPDRSDEILVYTTLFSGNGEYRYIRFVQFDK